MAKSRSSRLFLALDLPAAARADIASWRNPLVGDLRPVAAASLHVTLVFLGWREEAEVRRIATVAGEAAAGKRAASLAPAGVRGVPRHSPRLFTLELEDRGGLCGSLQSSLVAALAEAGLHRREKRPFWPHLTLARVRRGQPADERGGGRARVDRRLRCRPRAVRNPFRTVDGDRPGRAAETRGKAGAEEA
ncbi:MAG: RNA 2',3'-cyclic phosphodiesterase [Actinomycetota bacterium]|nr:RNA 2',3'-cyclic phosphodiesterase [Actinomycetota bacterium]